MSMKTAKLSFSSLRRTALVLALVSAAPLAMGCAVAPGGDAVNTPVDADAVASPAVPTTGLRAEGSLDNSVGVQSAGGEFGMWMLEASLTEPLKGFIGSQTGDLLIDLVFGAKESETDKKLADMDKKLDELLDLAKDSNERTKDLQKEMRVDTAFIDLAIQNQAFTQPFTVIDAQTSKDDTSSISLYSFTKPGAVPSVASMNDFVTYYPVSNLDNALDTITTTLDGDYLQSAARYFAIADQSADGAKAMSALENRFLYIVGQELKALKVISAKYQFQAQMNPEQRAELLASLNTRMVHHQANFKRQTAAYLKATATLAGMLGSNPAHCSVSESGQITAHAEISRYVGRAVAIAHGFEKATASGASAPGVAHIAVLSRSVDEELASSAITSASVEDAQAACGAWTAVSSPSACTSGWTHPGMDPGIVMCCTHVNYNPGSSTVGVPSAGRTLAADSSETGRYGAFYQRSDKSLGLRFESGWRIADYEIALAPEGRTKWTHGTAHVTVTVGDRDGAVVRTLDLTAAPVPEGQDAATGHDVYTGAVDLRFAGQSSQLMNKATFAPNQHNSQLTYVALGQSDANANSMKSSMVRGLAHSGSSSGGAADQWTEVPVTIDESVADAQIMVSYKSQFAQEYTQGEWTPGVFHDTYGLDNTCSTKTMDSHVMTYTNEIKIGDTVVASESSASNYRCDKASDFHWTYQNTTDDTEQKHQDMAMNHQDALAWMRADTGWTLGTKTTNLGAGKQNLTVHSIVRRNADWATGSRGAVEATTRMTSFQVYDMGNGR